MKNGRAKAFDQWWHLACMNAILPTSSHNLAREAYYAAWGDGSREREIERLRAALRQIEALETDTVPTSSRLAIARSLARMALDGANPT
jgi:hypothetical protein